MNEKDREVLHSLCNGDITFLEASEILGVSKEDIERMLENYRWLPSPEKLIELHETEMETLSHIRVISQPINIRVLHPQVELRFVLMQFKDSITQQLSSIYSVVENIPALPTGNVVLNRTQHRGVTYKLCH